MLWYLITIWPMAWHVTSLNFAPPINIMCSIFSIWRRLLCRARLCHIPTVHVRPGRWYAVLLVLFELFDGLFISMPSTGWWRHWNFDPAQRLERGPEILDHYIRLSCLRWLPTACHERLAYFHWPQWVTWLVTWWVTWSRSPDAGRHIGNFPLWISLLRFSKSAQISLFSNFIKLGQLLFFL